MPIALYNFSIQNNRQKIAFQGGINDVTDFNKIIKTIGTENPARKVTQRLKIQADIAQKRAKRLKPKAKEMVESYKENAIFAKTKENIRLNRNSKQLVAQMSDLIEDMWTDIRKSGMTAFETPKVHIPTGDEGKLVIVKPLYNNDKTLLLSIEDKNHLEHIFINCKSPDSFRYESYVFTDYGSARLKSYDSLRDNDSKIDEMINGKIDKYFSKIFPKES